MDPRCKVFRWKKEIVVGLFFFNTATSEGLGLKSSTYCLADYLTYCSKYSIQDRKWCFQKYYNYFSKSCVQALIQEGELRPAISPKIKKIENSDYPLTMEWNSKREQIEYNSITVYGFHDKNQ